MKRNQKASTDVHDRAKMPSIVLVILLCLTVILFAGCAARIPDYQNVEVESLDLPLKVPEAEYRDVVWLDEETLAFVYRKPEFGDRDGDYRIALYRFSNEVWKDIPSPTDLDKCYAASRMVRDLARLPNGNLGFTYICSGEHGLAGMLYEWDIVEEEVHLLFEYPPPFLIGEYTFSPDMSQWIQEGRKGDGLSNELYWVKQQEESTRILTEFKRASAPAWSPDGNTIALIGTKIHPEQPDGPQAWSDIENLALYPWDLYLMDADGSNLRMIFPKIGRPYHIRWSNDNQHLFFAGSRPNATDGGIWRLDLETNEIARLWPYNTFFDLSPDQTQMVIIAREITDGVERSYPLIAAVPSP